MKIILYIVIASSILGGCSSNKPIITNKPTKSSSACRKELISQDSRTQGGEWIWFPGKYRSKSLAHATTMAYGQALDGLISECGQTHKEIKFNEKCILEEKGTYFVFTRASITQKQCAEAKYGSKKLKQQIYNKELQRKLNDYRAYIADAQLNGKLCNKSKPEDCYLQAYSEWKSDNRLLAIAYAKEACRFGDYKTCGFLGYLFYELKDIYKARKHLKFACQHKDEISCKDLKEIEAEIAEGG